MKKSLLFAAMALCAMGVSAQTYSEYFNATFEGKTVEDGGTVYAELDAESFVFEANVNFTGTSVEEVPVVCTCYYTGEPTKDDAMIDMEKWGFMTSFCGGRGENPEAPVLGNCWSYSGMNPEILSQSPVSGENMAVVPAASNGFFQVQLHNYRFGAPEGDAGRYKITVFPTEDEDAVFTYYVVFSSNHGGVNDLDADENAPKEFFNLQGVQIANPTKGIYIVRQGTKTWKEVVR